MPIEIYEEIKGGNDDLARWAKDSETESALLLDEEVEIGLVQMVIQGGYAPNLTDIELEKIGRDPFLIAYAVKDPANRRIVTTEGSRPSRLRANRHIPDVCIDLGVEPLNTFRLVRELNFNTNWNA